MKPKLIVVDDTEGIERLIRYLSDKTFIAFDCETTGLTKSAKIIGYSVCAEEGRAFYVILAAWSVEIKELIVFENNVAASIPLLKSLQGRSLLMHNGLFDCVRVEDNFKISLVESLHTDTMILAHLLNENRRVGLKELGKEIFGEDATAEAAAMKESVIANGGTLTKKAWEGYKADPYLMGEYGAKDALLTYRLFYHLVPELYEQGLDQFFYEDESMPLLRGATYQLNTSGIKVDTSAMSSLKKQLEAECLEARNFIYAEIAAHIKTKYPGTNKKTTFSITSSQQLAWLLFGELRLEFGKLTDGGKEVARRLDIRPYTAANKRAFIEEVLTREGGVIELPSIINGKPKPAKKMKSPWAYIAVDKETLKKLAPRYKWIERLLEYQRKTKLLSTYIKGIESRLEYGIIRPNFLQHGTTSGRYASRDPNFQNLPRDDKRIKECMVARPGKVFVGADYSQLEPRVFAYFSGDERLLAAFKGTDDFYSVIGMEVYGKYDCTPQKEGSSDAFGIKYKKLRDLSKVIALASTYGATARQLMATTGKSEEATQEDIDTYFERFPGVAEMMLRAHETAKRDGQVVNLFGRPRRIPDAKRIIQLYGNQPHSALPYEARGLLNLAVNHTIQSTGASIVNRASIQFVNDCKEIGIEARLIVQVHDSLVAECAEADAENVALILRNAMEETTKLEGIDLEAIPKIGYNLAEV